MNEGLVWNEVWSDVCWYKIDGKINKEDEGK
jgi:hypothetical protein